ncbi:phosphoribosylformylglycinamidine synthase subunit PurS, partial [candidate division KSB1 bacterium]|nr:phosphoribosylformylglycinamidine synthase subunit PurS [candidate division KSB1 bacterium]
MITRIELTQKKDFYDAAGVAISHGAADLGIKSVQSVHAFQVYYLLGDLLPQEKQTIAESLLADTVTQDYAIDARLQRAGGKDTWSVEVTFNRGVTDMVAETALKGIRDLGIDKVEEAKTARRYEFTGKISNQQKETIVQKLLINKVVEHILQPEEKLFFPKTETPFQLIHVPITAASDQELERVSRERDLFLNLEEMRTIRNHFKSLGREPTDVELEMLAQTWSEHCSHKTLTGLVEFDGRTIDNPLKQTIFRVTRELNKAWCVSVFKDNAGIIEFDDDFNVCFKVETHNHPSAMEPYGGANTGIGGVIRDPLGTGLGAKPIMNTDVFCFGPPDMADEDVPPGALHPRRVMKGVVSGVRDYGNRMG